MPTLRSRSFEGGNAVRGRVPQNNVARSLAIEPTEPKQESTVRNSERLHRAQVLSGGRNHHKAIAICRRWQIEEPSPSETPPPARWALCKSQTTAGRAEADSPSGRRENGRSAFFRRKNVLPTYFRFSLKKRSRNINFCNLKTLKERNKIRYVCTFDQHHKRPGKNKLL